MGGGGRMEVKCEKRKREVGDSVWCGSEGV